MTDPLLEEVRRRLSVPVSPSDTFARALLDRLEELLYGGGLSPVEIDSECGEQLPLREAMSVISTDPLGPVDPGAVLGDVEPGTEPT